MSPSSMNDLENQANKIEASLNLARKKAISTGNQWIFQVDLSNQTYEIANDDGWKGTLTAATAESEPRIYYTGNPDFDTSKRNNGVIDINERMEGPYALANGCRIVDDTGGGMDSDITIIFNTRGGISSAATIWLVDRNYPRPFPVYPTHNQRLHRRKITIFTSGMIKIGN